MKSEHPCSRPVIWSRRWSWCKSASYDNTVPFQTKPSGVACITQKTRRQWVRWWGRFWMTSEAVCQMTRTTVLYTMNSRLRLPKRQLAVRTVLPEGWCRGVLTRLLRDPVLFELETNTCHLQITAPGFTHICASLHTVMRRIKTFQSTTDRIYDGSRVRL